MEVGRLRRIINSGTTDTYNAINQHHVDTVKFNHRRVNAQKLTAVNFFPRFRAGLRFPAERIFLPNLLKS